MGNQPDTRDIDAQLTGHFLVAAEFVRDPDRGPVETQAVVEAATDHVRNLSRERAAIIADAE
ncbi:hypothetical protein [Halopiger djelfimassiliensis]|uniref:hypothetical protein n=1 Tax=Halopiger djelfimassiliensis TaxID=1293047 RepID=UPI000677DC47|nr:hypothetical protein [Halopiger djelfimassiliensis]